jgi:hypothetical protein
MQHIVNCLDGDTFTDCNYWKRFAYPQVAQNQKPSLRPLPTTVPVWSDVASGKTPTRRFYNMQVIDCSAATSPTTRSTILLAILAIRRQSCRLPTKVSTAVRVRVNGVADAAFDLGAGETQVAQQLQRPSP